mmetsp:Transcript_17524/g.26259  ORF Transcript_17524/g.26259 Transcript_17524/m.26259 type:complete len:231 (+) Transcript_17524:202-894(+)
MKALSWRGKYTNMEYYPVKVFDYEFKLSQVPSGELKGIGTGSTVWEGGQILLKFIEFRYGKNGIVGKTVIDLGSGTGAVGLTAAVLGAKHVTLTDQKQVLDITRRNVKSCAESVKNPQILKNVSVCEYNWGEDAKALGAPFDIILVADCIVPKLYPMKPLVDALERVADAKSSIFICYDHRVNSNVDPRVKFPKLCVEAGFSVKNIPYSLWHPDYVLTDCYIWELKKISV